MVAAAKNRKARGEASEPGGGPNLVRERMRKWLLDSGAAIDEGSSLTLKHIADPALKRQAAAVWRARADVAEEHEAEERKRRFTEPASTVIGALQSLLPAARSLKAAAERKLERWSRFHEFGKGATETRVYKSRLAEIVNGVEAMDALRLNLEALTVRPPKKNGRPQKSPLRDNLAIMLVEAGLERKEVAYLLAVPGKTPLEAVDTMRKGMPTRKEQKALDLLAQECRDELDRQREQDEKQRAKEGVAHAAWLAEEARVSPARALAFLREPLDYKEDVGRLATAAGRFREMSPEERRAALRSVPRAASPQRRVRPKPRNRSE